MTARPLGLDLPVVRVGVPLTGGQLVAAARSRGFPVLFSANAFARVYSKASPRHGYFKGFALPNPEQFEGLDAALDSAGFVAASRYGDYRWTVEDYYDLVAAHPWAWHASMDYCCEPQVANDRLVRLLRLAGTAQLLGQCRREAQSRGLPMPMPVIQGWTTQEYALCAEWLPLPEWPELVGIGSMCRRNLHGPDGIFAILSALDEILPAHVRVHLFGVKSGALEKLATHPRLASIDSMAWDMQARTARRTGRDMEFRIGHMEAWAHKQHLAVVRGSQTAQFNGTVFIDPKPFGGFTNRETLVLEALALQWVDLLLENNLDYASALASAQRDAVYVIPILRQYDSLSSECLAHLDDSIFNGLSDRIESLLLERGLPCPS